MEIKTISYETKSDGSLFCYKMKFEVKMGDLIKQYDFLEFSDSEIGKKELILRFVVKYNLVDMQRKYQTRIKVC